MLANRKSIFIVAAVALVLGLMGWTLSKRLSGGGTDPVEVPVTSTIDGTAPAPTRTGPSTGPQGISPDDPGSIFAKPVDPIEEAREHQRIVADFERKFKAEAVDAAWAAKAEPALSKLVTNDGIVMSGIDPDGYRSECRSDTCRISARFKNQLDADAWASMYTTMTGETFHETRHMVIPQPDGTAEVLIFGYRLR